MIPSDPCMIDFLFVVDGSASIKEAFRPQLDFAEKVVQQLTIGPEYQRTALIQYSTYTRMKVEFTFTTFSTQGQVMV